LGRGDFTFGQFGENFTVEGFPDNEVASAIATALVVLNLKYHSRA
jgi:MOSC domain-containing protein YiiM